MNIPNQSKWSDIYFRKARTNFVPIMFKMVTCYWCCLMSPQLSFSPATGARPVWPPWAHVVPLVWSDPAPGSLHLFLHRITSPSSGMEENQDSLIRGLYPVQHCCLLNMFRVIANLSESWDELTIKKQLLCCVTVEVDIQSQSNFTLASTYTQSTNGWNWKIIALEMIQFLFTVKTAVAALKTIFFHIFSVIYVALSIQARNTTALILQIIPSITQFKVDLGILC